MQDGGSDVVDKEENLMRKVYYLQTSESLLPSKVSPLLLPNTLPQLHYLPKGSVVSFSWSPPPISLQGWTQEVSFLFCYCKWEFRPYWFQAFFFPPLPAFRNTSFLRCSSDLQLPRTKAVNGFRLRYLCYLWVTKQENESWGISDNADLFRVIVTLGVHCHRPLLLTTLMGNPERGKPVR